MENTISQLIYQSIDEIVFFPTRKISLVSTAIGHRPKLKHENEISLLIMCLPS